MRFQWIAIFACLLAFPLLNLSQAIALNETNQDQPQDAGPDSKIQSPHRIDNSIPLPDPVVDPLESATDSPAASTARDNLDDGPVPEVLRDPELLPEPVRRMRNLIIEACRSGDIEKLRPLLGFGDSSTQLSFGLTEDDPLQTLLSFSGDEQGHEILAILLEVLEAGFVRLDAGEPNEIFVWPYFFALPLDRLTAPQRVELFKIVTAGDFEDMKSFGAYIFYRVGITPEGRWLFFVAGD